MSLRDAKIYQYYPQLKLDIMRRTLLWLRSLDHKRRQIPETFILGFQKCATTSLYAYLVTHPQVQKSFLKEPKYFDLFNYKSKAWYSAHFEVKRPHCISIDATPDYVLFPEIISLIQAHCKSPKFILILRNPINRAYSQFEFSSRRGYETKNFNKSIIAEHQNKYDTPSILDPFDQKMLHYRENNYIYRSLYGKQLMPWLNAFGQERFKLIHFESFVQSPQRDLKEICKFLGLNEHKFDVRKPENVAPDYKINISQETNLLLSQLFTPDLEALHKHFGYQYFWIEEMITSLSKSVPNA